MSQGKKKGGRKKLWRGLTVIMAFILSLSIGLGTILEAYKTTIDASLGTTSEALVSDDEDELYSVYTPDEEYLNEDGTGNSNALIAAAIELGAEEEAEGAVLLKNENDALPLDSGSDVTLLGIRSVVTILGMTTGCTTEGPYISLATALSSDTTDFANTIATEDSSTDTNTATLTIDAWTGDEFEIDGADFNVNPTMIEIYEELNATYGLSNNETVVETYSDQEPSLDEIASVNADYADSFVEYGDAAIIVIGRSSSEAIDYTVGGVDDTVGSSTEPLQLTDDERALIDLAEENFEEVIVIINSCNVMEVSELEEDDGVDAILWIGYPGAYGLLGVAQILSGEVNPSGALVNIYPTTNLSSPSTVNVGNYQYTNADEITRTSLYFGDLSTSYVIEAEDIYVGYRYYETRYYDCVVGQGNADSTAGAYASTDGWSYSDEVVYSFGYGLSYTTFTQEFVGEPTYTYEVDSDTGGVEVYATFEVEVTNTGDVAGSSIVQIYGSAPYYEGGVEKSAIQLLDYEKSSVLEPGESETLTITVDLQNIASYDDDYENDDGTTGTYILDEGTYYFSIGNGAHDALNNVLAAQGYTTDDGMDYDGDASKAVAQVFAEEEGDDVDLATSVTVFSVSKNGTSVSNHLDYADWNYFQEGEVTYLSRSDWEATYPVEYDSMTLTSEDLISLLAGEYYEVSYDDDTSDIVWGSEDYDVQFQDLIGLDYDDELYDEAVDQMTLEEALYLASFGGTTIPGIESLGTVESSIIENSGVGIRLMLSASCDTSAPWTIGSDDANASWYGDVFTAESVLASSFNNDLCYEVGEFVGNEALFLGIAILWGPGANIVRTAYNGRNAEYFSEDPVVTGCATMEFSQGAYQYGLVCAAKHYSFNDQSTNRHGLSPYMTEQRAREIELRAFQIAVESADYDTDDYDAALMGVMISFSKIGPVECTASEGLMTSILREEWGFEGYAVTDIYDDTDIWAAVLVSGTTGFDTRGVSGFYGTTTLESNTVFTSQLDGTTIGVDLVENDSTIQESVKETVHALLYVYANSNLANRYNSSSHLEQQVTWWRVAYVSLIVVSAALTVVFAVCYAKAGSTKKKEAK